MRICPACGHMMPESPDACEVCGEKLAPRDAAGDTLVTNGDELLSSSPKRQKVWKTAKLSKKRTIKASIAKTKAVVTITLNSRQDTILGRMDKAAVRVPDIDLTEHGALKTGVSRLHAMLRLEDRMGMVQVKDLESSNGTFLNGRRVAANEWSIVRNDDELRLGSLVMTLHFDD